MRFRLAVLAIAAALWSAAGLAAQLPPQTVSGLVDSQLPTNQSGYISASALRAVLHDMIDSTPNFTALYPVTNSVIAYTFQQSDQSKSTTFTSATVALSLVKPGGLPPTSGSYFPNGWWTVVTASSASTLTITPAGALINGASSLTMSPSTTQLISTDGVNYYAIQLGGGSGGGGLGALPAAVSGTVNSGGVPCFTSSILMQTSGVLAANAIIVGGGSGACPSTVTTAAGALAALAIAPGSVGSVILNGGVGGTPSSINLANASSLPLSAIPSLGAGVPSALTQAVNAASGLPLLSGSFTGTHCLEWSAFGIADAGAPCSLGSAIMVGSTAIGGGTPGDIVYDNSGIVGEVGTTGSGNVVLATNAVLVTPNLGTPSAITLTNGGGLPLSTGLTGWGSGVLSAVQATANGTAGIALVNATPTVGHCLDWASGGVADAGSACGSVSTITIGSTVVSGGTPGYVLYDNAGVVGNTATTGSGNVVLATSPTLVTPALGTPASGNAANLTNIPMGNAAGVLAFAHGGTGLSSLGSAGQCLVTNSGLTAIAWGSCGAASIANVSGSAENTTGTISASSASLTLGSAIDFVNGEGIRVNHAGLPFSLSPPTAASVTPQGTTGSTTYHYELACLDAAGGVGAAITSFDTTTGNATLSLTNYNKLSWTNGGGCSGAAVFREIVSTYTLIGVAAAGTTFADYGYTAYPYIDWIPTVAPSSALADALITTVSSGGGTASLVLAASATTTTSSPNNGVFHDDTVALQTALNANNYLLIPPGTYYISTGLTVPASVYVEGKYQATALQSVFLGSSVMTLANGATSGIRASNLAFYLIPATKGINATFVTPAWIDNIQCYGASTGGIGHTQCLYFNYDWAITTHDIFMNDWAASIGAGSGGATPTIFVDDSTHSSTQLYFSHIIAKSDGNQPADEAMVTLADCFNCNLTDSILGANSIGASTVGLELIGENQAINISDLQTLGFTDNLRTDSDATGSLLTMNITGGHFDYCGSHCIFLNTGRWVNIHGVSFAGESIAGNYAIYGSTSFNAGPNTITGNTIEGFNGPGSGIIFAASSVTYTTVAANQIDLTTTPFGGTAGTGSAFGQSCSGTPSSSFSSVNGIVGHC